MRPIVHANYRSDIDGLRAIAVIPVVLFHCGVKLFSGGFVGVDIFFVISGYLITKNIINQIEQEKFCLSKFYKKRMLRILPAFFVMVLITWLISFVFILPPYLADLSRSLLAASFGVSNIYLWRAGDYFSTF